MIQYRVVAVPERLERAEALAAVTGGVVVVDSGRHGAFRNHVRALESATSGSHVVVLEDDAILCGDFTKHVERLVRERPDHLLGLYVGRSHPRRVQPVLAEVTSRAGWVDDAFVCEALRWGVGYVMPRADVPAVLEGLAAGDQHAWLHTDKRIGAWHAARGRLLYPIPSPVDHDVSVPSTLSRGKSGRVAWVHCGEAS